MNEVVKLPLWKNALDALMQQGVEYGMVVKYEWMEEQLRVKREEMQYQMGVSNIRRELEKQGFYLTGRGQDGDFIIIPPQDNQHVMRNYQSQAADLIRRACVLGSSTRMDLLDEQQKAKHEKVLQVAQTRMVLLARTKSFANIAQKYAPKLLS